MRLQKTTIQTGADSSKTLWAGSQGQASKDRTELKKLGAKDAEGKKVLPETVEVDVPTNKVDLITWLNENAA